MYKITKIETTIDEKFTSVEYHVTQNGFTRIIINEGDFKQFKKAVAEAK